MGNYVKKKIWHQMEILDSRKLPKKWNLFIQNTSKQHNLILKRGKKYLCTCCNNEFSSNKKVYEKDICPYCKQKLNVRNHNIKNYIFEDWVTMLDKVDDEVLIRVFSLRSIYQPRIKKFISKAVEFGRVNVSDNVTMLNERIRFYLYSVHVDYYKECGKWHRYSGYYTINTRGDLYPYNIKSALKGTRYQYSMLWDFVKNIPGCDLLNLLTGVAKCSSFELLVKLKLYNLALDANKFEVKGDFKKRFGIEKEFYPFMRKYNINTEELEILQLIKEPDINKIRKIKNDIGMHHMRDISKIVDFKSVLPYVEKTSDISLYIDYLEFAQKLGMNMKDKKILFPKNLKKLHDEYHKKIEFIVAKETCENVKNRSKELEKNKYQNEKFIVFPAESVDALKDESNQQGHCVRDYAKRYGDAECDIYFMRLIENIKKSLVTIEVRQNKIIQKRIKNNDPTTKEQNLFLEKWQELILQKSRV